MAKTQAFTKFIGPIGSGENEGGLVHQVSPTWVITFVRWDVRDTLRAIPSTGNSQELFQVRDPLVVENDCVQLSTTMNKTVLTHSMTAMLVETDINYETAIAPGDFIFVNMLNWEQDARRVANQARKLKPINGPNDGFKGIFKVQGARKTIIIDPLSGVKRVLIKINGFAFTEFNNVMYYNPYLRTDNQGSGKDDLLFITNLQADYSQLINPSTNPHCQDIIKFLIQSFIGVGISDKGVLSVAGSPITANTHFYIPQQIGSLLGISGAKAAKDVYNYLFGIQQYSGSPNQILEDGMNPSNLDDPIGRFYYTKTKCDGQTLLRAEYWNQTNAWSIINQYTNSPLNELYTCFRLSPSGDVMPTVVFRQIPFNSDLFGTTDPFNISATVTKFLSLPRWKISTALIFNLDLGRDEAGRINFVQYYAQPPTDVGKPEAFISAQTASRNFVYDINDVVRSGLRPYVLSTSFEDLTIQSDEKVGRKWALIVGDSVIGGHLKLNGTMECVGIVDPITIGDNLEYDGTVFHIEEIVHTCSINPENGIKMFRTIFKLSNGVSVSDTRSGLAYAEMIHTNAYKDRKANYGTTQSMPGVSEEQDIVSRPKSPAPSTKDIKKPDTPFSQPGQVIIPIKKDETNE